MFDENSKFEKDEKNEKFDDFTNSKMWRTVDRLIDAGAVCPLPLYGTFYKAIDLEGAFCVYFQFLCCFTCVESEQVYL